MEAIDQPLLLSILRKIEKRGAIETARRINQRISAIYRFARAQGLKMENPSDGINDALAPLPPSKRYPALLNLPDIRTMIANIDIARASPITRLASRFLALTAQRPGMVRHLEWAELQNIDWGNPDAELTDARWCVPAAKMKQELRLRSDDTFDHIVPLTRQAVETLRAVRCLTGTAKYVFPNARSGMEPASENAIGYLYNREGYRGRHVPHGWRSSFSTLMNEYAERTAGEDPRVLGDRKIIDLMLAHTPSGLSPSELRYNRASYMDRRRQLATLWADMIMEGAMPVESIINGPRR